MVHPSDAGAHDAATSLTGGRFAMTAAWCLLLFLVAVMCRVAYLRQFGIESQEGGDMGGYMALARNLVDGRGFSIDGVNPSTYRPPLFSWLLAFWCWLLGSTGLKMMVAYQVVIQSLGAPLTFLLVREVQGGRRFAIAAGLFMATYPYLITTVSLVLQEPTQTVAAAIMGLCVASWWRAPSVSRAVIAGSLLGVCALAKSPFLAGPPIVLLVYYGVRGAPVRPPARQVWLVVAVSAAVVMPWTLRNAVVSGGRLMPINSQDLTMPIWMVADGNFRWRESPTDPPPAAFQPERGVGFGYGHEEGVAYLRRQNDELLRQGVRGAAVAEGLAAASRSYLLCHPAYVLRLMARGTILSFAPYAVGPFRPILAPRIVAMVLFHIPLAFGLAAGFIRALRTGDAAVVMLSLLVAVYILAHLPATVEGGRYASTMIPLMIAITGYGLFGERPRRGGEPAAF